MRLTRGIKTTVAVARSNSVATQVEEQHPTKRESMRIVNGILTSMIGDKHVPSDVVERQTDVWLWKDGFAVDRMKADQAAFTEKLQYNR